MGAKEKLTSLKNSLDLLRCEHKDELENYGHGLDDLENRINSILLTMSDEEHFKENKERFIKNPNVCIFCGSETMFGRGSVDLAGEKLSFKELSGSVRCEACNSLFDCMWTLSDVLKH